MKQFKPWTLMKASETRMMCERDHRVRKFLSSSSSDEDEDDDEEESENDTKDKS